MLETVEANLRAFEGRVVLIERAEEPVTALAIRQWCDVVGERSPEHLDPTSPAAIARGGLTAPAAMLPIWSRPSSDLSVTWAVRDATGMADFDSAALAAGLTDRIATNTETTIYRPLRVGDLVEMRQVIESISALKATSIGSGVFVNFRQTVGVVLADAPIEACADIRYRVFRYRHAMPKSE